MDELKRQFRQSILRWFFVTSMVMSAGFAIEELLLGAWPWWAWGMVSIASLAGLIVTEIWFPRWQEKKRLSRRKPMGMHVVSELRADIELVPDKPPSLRQRIGSIVGEIRKDMEILERWLSQ